MLRRCTYILRAISIEIRNVRLSAATNMGRSYATKAKNSSQSLPKIRDPFATVQVKNKETFVTMVDMFMDRDKYRRNHCEFIWAALKHMPDYGVENDLEVYKALINILPKDKFIPDNVFAPEFQLYPKQQQCIIDVLEQMEDNGVMPDYSTEELLMNIFGRHGYPLRKYWRMMYWMPKFKHLSPWPVPNPVPADTLEIGRLAVQRMCSVDVNSVITEFDTKEVSEVHDKTWIVSGMSREQCLLLCEHPKNEAVYIEGPFRIWVGNRSVQYFMLRADPHVKLLASLDSADAIHADDVSHIKAHAYGRFQTQRPQKNAVGKVRSVHQQYDGTIFAVCVTGTSTKDSLLSWLRLLVANGNPVLSELAVVFRLKSEVPDEEKFDALSGGMSDLTVADDKRTNVQTANNDDESFR